MRARVVSLLLVGAVVVVPSPSAVTAVPSGTVTPVVTGVASTATAVLANLTMVNGKAPGYITAAPCSTLQGGPQATSNGNHGLQQAVANLAVVPLDPDGRFCIVNQSAVELLADVEGYLAPAAPGGLSFVASAPTRVLDTRPAPMTRPTAGSITRVATGAPSGTEAVLVNIAMIDAVAGGYITADRCTALQPGEQTRSNGNYGIGVAVSNLSVVPVDSDGSFCVFTRQAVDLVVDVQGTFSQAAGGLGFEHSATARVLDTRVAPSVKPATGSTTTVHSGAPAGTSAVLANITMVDGTAPGYVTADTCAALQPGQQPRSTGNHGIGSATSNLAVVPVADDGSFCVYNQQSVNLAVDIEGFFSSTGAQQFFPLSSRRVLDTRPPTPTEPYTSCSSVVHIGDSTSVGLIWSAVIQDPALRIDAQYRRVGVSDPRMEISGARSIVETLPGQINAYDTAKAIKASGYHGCWVFALGTTDTANIAAGSGPGRAARIEKMMALVDGDPVMWVNVKTLVADGPWANSNMLKWNEALEQAAPNYPNLYIYDWAAVAQNAWFSGDRVHYTVDGFIMRAHLIADALATTFPG
jgi:hypothetical protein